MPCSSEGYGDYQKLQQATKVACELAEHIDKNSKVQLLSIQSISPETKQWVIEHREIDRKRIEREAAEENKRQIRKNALDKLTHEEKKALDLSI